MSWLGRLNYYFLQWLCMRLAYEVDNVTGDIKGWSIIFVKPLSGYNGTKFKWLWVKKPEMEERK